MAHDDVGSLSNSAQRALALWRQQTEAPTADLAALLQFARKGDVLRIDYLERKAREIPKNDKRWSIAARIIQKAREWRWAMTDRTPAAPLRLGDVVEWHADGHAHKGKIRSVEGDSIIVRGSGSSDVRISAFEVRVVSSDPRRRIAWAPPHGGADYHRRALRATARLALLEMETLAMRANELALMAEYGRTIENQARARRQLPALAKTSNIKRTRVANRRQALYQRAAIPLAQRHPDWSINAIAEHLSSNPPRGARALSADRIRHLVGPVVRSERNPAS